MHDGLRRSLLNMIHGDPTYTLQLHLPTNIWQLPSTKLSPYSFHKPINYQLNTLTFHAQLNVWAFRNKPSSGCTKTKLQYNMYNINIKFEISTCHKPVLIIICDKLVPHTWFLHYDWCILKSYPFLQPHNATKSELYSIYLTHSHPNFCNKAAVCWAVWGLGTKWLSYFWPSEEASWWSQIPKCCKSARSCLTKSSEFYAEGVHSLVNHCDKCLNLHDHAEIYAIALLSHEKSYFK